MRQQVGLTPLSACRALKREPGGLLARRMGFCAGRMTCGAGWPVSWRPPSRTDRSPGGLCGRLGRRGQGEEGRSGVLACPREHRGLQGDYDVLHLAGGSGRKGRGA